MRSERRGASNFAGSMPLRDLEELKIKKHFSTEEAKPQ